MVRGSLTVLAFSILIFTIIGCGGDGDLADFSKSDNPVHVATYIQALSDKVGSPAFSDAFAEGSRPTKEQEKQYLNLQFEAAELPVVNGDTAKVKVKIKTEILIKNRKKALSSPESKPADRVAEWDLVRTDDGWKLKNAPIK